MNQSIDIKRPIKELVSEYDAAVADVRRAWGIIESAEVRLNRAMGDPEKTKVRDIRVSDQSYRCPSWNQHSLDDVLGHVRRQCWRTLVQRLELRRFLSIKAHEDLEKLIAAGEMPEITQRSVTDVVQSFASQMDALLTDAVKEVYNWLRPWRETYKTNSPYQVGKKVIIEYMVEPKWSKQGFNVVYRQQQHLTALENVFSALDGQGQISKGYHSELQRAIEASEDGRGETRYFRFRAFKNHNLHVEFKRLDLVEQLNKVAGALSLKPKTGHVA